MHWTLITSYNVKASILHFNLLLTQYIVSQYNTYYTIFVWSALEDTKHTEVYPSVRNVCTLIGRNASRNTRINKLFTTILSVLSFLLRFTDSDEKI